ncbi:MFS transporter [Methylobacterium pseudosasicola]|uniref:MFS transporter, putative metabolite:H+ symporter n=1 Tax=Methylobacterium pseudosasicola TaxID=582667 RepID=A0A1I4H6C2_9HYPH|nr:MFS transporter [Methylobacterium pseudosasicola]SFL37310.1 MFS transporter, putative metabolite:H+ symporter [Methylobacterium pseudosasicola]
MIETSGRPVAPGGTPHDGAGASLDAVALRLDRLPLTRLHLAILAVCTLGLFTDVAEVALSNALAAIFLAPPHNMPRGSLSLLLASVFAGGAVGAPVFGLIGDRFGRRKALQATLGLMAIGSMAAALSSGLTALTVARVVSGFAIGGFPPLAATYLADVMPPRRRGAMLLVCAGIGFLGGSAVILLVQALAPGLLGIAAWRWALVLGAVLAFAGAILFARLPESPRWLASVGRAAAAERACRRFEVAAGMVPPAVFAEPAPDPRHPVRAGLRALLAEPRQLRRTALFVGLYGLAPWATVGFPLLSAVVMLQKGFRVDQSLVFAGLSMLGPPLGTLLTATVIDRLERRACLVALAAAMVILGTAFAIGETFETLVLIGLAFNTAAAIYGGLLAVYATELLSTALRASALTCAWAGGRVAAALTPIVLLPVLAGYGIHAMFAVLTATLVASGALVLGGPRGRSGRPVVR